MDVSVLLESIGGYLIVVALIGIVGGVIKTPWVKGKFGEFLVNATLTKKFDKDIYRLFKDVTLILKDGSTTQIDHILVSKFGIVVIETKHMKGWIFGSEGQKEWVQQIYKKKSRFQNPIHQNYRHIKALEELMGLSFECFKSIVVFTGNTEFKTPLPENVYNNLAFSNDILALSEEIVNPLQLRQTVRKLERKKLVRGLSTDGMHINNLNQRHAEKA